MTQFALSHGELMPGGERLSTLTARAGQTSFYAYGRSQLRQWVTELRQALPSKIRMHYAMKANPMLALVGLMAGLINGVDVASAGELEVALDAGVNPKDISFAGPGKRDAELRQAVATGVLELRCYLVVDFQPGDYGASASPYQFLAHPPCVDVLV